MIANGSLEYGQFDFLLYWEVGVGRQKGIRLCGSLRTDSLIYLRPVIGLSHGRERKLNL